MDHQLAIRNLLLPALLCAAGNLSADEVTLEDGRVLVGKTRQVGESLLVETLDGEQRIALSSIKRIRTDDDLRLALDQLAMRSGAGSCHAQLELARLGRDWGLYDEMWGYLAKVLRSAGDNEVMLRRSADFMGGLEKLVLARKWRGRSDEVKVRQLLFTIKNRIPRVKLATVEELLVRMPQVDGHLRTQARRSLVPLRRITAIRALARRPATSNARFVFRTAILDKHHDVRKAAMEITREIGHADEALEYMTPILKDVNGRFRVRTAEALAELADPRAIPALVQSARHIPPGGSTRASMAVIEQQSYVRDFDVEVAQGAFIAKPVVDIVQSGMVLDVTVISVLSYRLEIYRVYRKAIEKIAGDDPGADPKKWPEWLEKRTGAETSKDATGERQIKKL